MRIAYFICGIVSIVFASCGGGQSPTVNDIIGTWKSSDGANFIFNKDGAFIVKSFPAEFVFQMQAEYKNVRFDGSGKWLLRRGNANWWEVYLDFEKVSDEKCRSAFPLLVSGENGVLENQPPWYLFVWKEEEGGDRYKFVKK